MFNLFRGVLGRRYLGRYLALQPQVSQDQVEAWMIPVAAARLTEGIPGERQTLLEFIARSLREPQGA